MTAQFIVKAMEVLRFDVGPKSHFYNTTFIYLKQKQNKNADSLKASILSKDTFFIGCS